jgi:lipid II:glycine glycyltransferase (peptidoglycan interpeptide bridge formation enzyme)
MRFATEEEISQWDQLLVANPDGGNVFQSKELADLKDRTVWTARYVMHETLAVTVFERAVFGLGKLWYLPKGPGLTTFDELTHFSEIIQAFAKQNGVFAVKIEPEIKRDNGSLSRFTHAGFVPTTPIQPNFSTVIVDISEDLDTVLASLNQKGRHAIRRAGRDGVKIERVDTTDENCQLFYMLLAETAEQSFIIRSYEYYREFWQLFVERSMGQLFFAYHEGRVVAAAFAIILGEKSTYKDGASVRDRTAYGASHLLQWEVMTWAKEKGSKQHDLCGTPPSESINDTNHKWYGVGRFKTSFNKEVTDYIGAYDIVVRPTHYKIWKSYGERIAKSLEWRLHHRVWY